MPIVMAQKLVGLPPATAPVVSYNDGFLTAPTGSAQYPTLLSGYVARPPWHVVGVDYAAGYNTGTSLQDWRTISMTGVSVDVAGNSVAISGSAPVTLNAIDFSLGGGAGCYVTNAGLTTVTNSKFVTSTGGASNSSYALFQQGAGSLVFSNNTVDGRANGSSQAGIILLSTGASDATATLRYNWVRLGTTDDLVNTVCNSGGKLTLDMRFNLWEGGTHNDQQHADLLQTMGFGSIYSLITVDFNTYVLPLDPNSGGGTEGVFMSNNNPTYPQFQGSTNSISNNTIIANAGAQVFNGLIGVDASCLNGTAFVYQNYIDGTGLLVPGQWFDSDTVGGPYTGTVLKTGNVNMVTGAPLS